MAIEELGGHVVRDIKDRVTAIVLHEGATDAAIVHFEGLTSLRRLNLSSSQISDAGLKTLGQMSSSLVNLEWLDVSSTQVTENGIWHLKDLPSLRHLDVYNTQVPKPHVQFYFGRPKVAIEFFGVFERIERDDDSHDIVRIDFHSRTTDADLQLIDTLTISDDLKSLRVLDLGSTGITDAGLEALQRFPSLQVLDLSNTQITDAGLVDLKWLGKLESLSVKDTQVTEAGITDLKKALPDVEVSR